MTGTSARARRQWADRGRRAALCGALTLVACGGASAPASGPGVEGFVVTDDSVRLYYRSVGEGATTVVVPVAVYLSDLLAPLARGRRVVFYDPRSRGRSDRADLRTVSRARQIEDLEQLRAALGIERMALIGWSGLGMEMALYALAHPDRVERLVQISPVPPATALMRELGGDARAARTDAAAVDSLVARWERGGFGSREDDFCREYNALTQPASFVDTAFIRRLPDLCALDNEWPVHLWPYFGQLLSGPDYDLRDSLPSLRMPRLVIHGREDGIPIEGARAWVVGQPNARLVEVSPAGHFPFLELEQEVLPMIAEFLDGRWPARATSLPPP